MPKDTGDELAKLKKAVGDVNLPPKAARVVKRETLTDRVAVEPVRFSATIGRIYADDGRHDRFGTTETAPLIVDFGNGQGDEADLTGGLSRAFDPTLDECEREAGAGNVGSYCNCKHCLAVVREWIRRDRHGLVARYHIREEDVNPATKPYAGFDTAEPDDLAGAVKIGALVDLRNAVRWEQAHGNRAPILAKLDELDAAPEEAEDADIMTAEVVI